MKHMVRLLGALLLIANSAAAQIDELQRKALPVSVSLERETMDGFPIVTTVVQAGDLILHGAENNRWITRDSGDKRSIRIVLDSYPALDARVYYVDEELDGTSSFKNWIIEAAGVNSTRDFLFVPSNSFDFGMSLAQYQTKLAAQRETTAGPDILSQTNPSLFQSEAFELGTVARSSDGESLKFASLIFVRFEDKVGIIEFSAPPERYDQLKQSMYGYLRMFYPINQEPTGSVLF